ncbi:tRNA wybutosine-synthesizing protein [Aspergillus sclerotialis]|uniref:tRNA wybutosine-synthesizing protein n=1 Tax=Aspergillus sclerotialis TaxID=2070753 RepID=A0A3A2ZCI7_9EURO|nr:tRNA wybutosine-synthesizing protein [Aspergillus sclerotialis]
MLLLSSNALTAPPQWGALYASLSTSQRETLFSSIAQAFKNHGVTQIAINAPIAATDASGGKNRMRSPVGLVPLYGNFGPTPLAAAAAGEDEESKQPSEPDFNRAFWVRTVQNQGIVQIWAPLYTMFSRGNVTEKARILGQGGRFDGLDEKTGLRGETVGEISVVDMYAGIGYFVFS